MRYPTPCTVSIVAVAPSVASFLRSRDMQASSALSSTVEPSGQPALISERRRITSPGLLSSVLRRRNSIGVSVTRASPLSAACATESSRRPADLQARGPAAPAQERAHALGQLVERERLRDVVVPTRLEACDTLGHGVARRQEDDRDRLSASAQRRTEVAAVGIGQADVENQQVGAARVERSQQLGAARHGLDLEILLAQTANDDIAQPRVVLGQQQGVAHGLSMPVLEQCAAGAFRHPSGRPA